MEGNYTLSDIRAVTDGNDGMFGGNGLWFLALLFLFGNGGFGWGNRNGASDVCSSDLTETALL